jgi:tetratricopeptide (TPR) repeat protein
LQHYQDAIDMNTRIRGEGVAHAGIAFSHHDSGRALVEVGDPKAAMARFLIALDMRIRVYGKKPKESIAETALQLALLYTADQKNDLALEHFEMALDQYVRSFEGNDHKHIASLFLRIAIFHDTAGNSAAALPNFANSRDMYVRLLEEESTEAQEAAAGYFRLSPVQTPAVDCPPTSKVLPTPPTAPMRRNSTGNQSKVASKQLPAPHHPADAVSQTFKLLPGRIVRRSSPRTGSGRRLPTPPPVDKSTLSVDHTLTAPSRKKVVDASTFPVTML